MKNKLFLTLVVSLAMTSLLFASGTKENVTVSNPKMTISMLDGFTPGDFATAVHIQMKEYQKSNPNVTIDEESISNQDMAVKVQTLAAANELPDIYCMKGSMASSFIKNGKALDLSSYLEEDPEWNALFKEGVFSNFINNGKIYGIPYQITNTCIFYNAKMLSDLGYDAIPATWSSFVAMCKDIRSQGVTPIVLGNKDKWNAESVIFSTLGNRATGDTWYQSLRDKTGSKFTDPEFILALQSLSDLVAVGAFNSDVNSIDGAQQRQSLMNGKAVMTIEGSWGIPEFDNNCPSDMLENIQIAALPAVEGGKGNPIAISGGAGWAFAVNADIKPEKIANTIALIKTIMNEEFSNRIAATGSLTATKANDFELNSNQKVAIRFNEFQKDRPYIPVYDHQLDTSVIQVMQSGLQELLIGIVTPEQLAKNLQTEYERSK
jgi:raffinose/stachyose/melibiose transport system substrate-binding protein